MPSRSTYESAFQPSGLSGQLPAVITLGVAMPAAIVLLDMTLVSHAPDPWGLIRTALSYLLFVGQVGLLGWAVGTYLQHPVLRWGIYFWVLALIDLLVYRIAADAHAEWTVFGFMAQKLPYALLSAQIGWLAVWGVLGAASWKWRLPVAMLGVVLLVTMCGYFRDLGWRGQHWNLILFFQAISTFSICILLWLAGYHVQWCGPYRTETAPDTRTDRTDRDERLQFSIFHLLVWTTALAPLLALARFVDVPMLKRFGQLWQPVSLGAGLAMVSLVAIWSALGRGSVAVRLVTPWIFILCFGALLGYTSSQGWWNELGIEYMFTGGGDPGHYYFWIAWGWLASYFLAAMLLAFRASGCRLSRRGGFSRLRSIVLFRRIR